MKRTILVTGHKNPDTDSICSSIGYAHYKSQVGFTAKPIRIGDINPETAFALDRFGIDAPDYVKDIIPTVKDLDFDIPNILSPERSLREALDLFEKTGVSALGVVDSFGRLVGLVTLSDISTKYMESFAIKNQEIPVENFLSVLDASLLIGDIDSVNLGGDVHIAAMTPEKMKGYISNGDLMIVGDRPEAQLHALKEDIAYLVVTGGHEVTQDVLDLAKEKNCVVFLSSRSTFSVARRINLCLPVSSIMTENESLVKVNLEDHLSLVKERMLTNRYALLPVVDAQNKLRGFIGRFHLISPKRKQLILVDHNERSQSIKGLEHSEILEIIDHHKIGDVQTDNPIRFFNEPVGCTATIVANLYFDNSIDLPESIAGLLLSAIISDTLKFTSPTTTEKDYQTAQKLALVARVELQSYSLDLLKAGTSLEGKTPEELFHNDFKIFNIADYKFGVAQLNTMDHESIETYKLELETYMKDICRSERFDALVLVMTNILDSGSEIVFEGEASSIIRQAFDIPETDNHKYLKGVVSRKKQIIPKISILIEK